MGRPAKTKNIIDFEGKSHRTKEELEIRERAEEALLSKIKFKEKKGVKDNPVAHKEFLRIKKLFVAIEKNDGLYENAVNRYCQLFAECQDFENRREFFFEDLNQLRKEFEDKNIDFLTYDDKRSRLTGHIIALDKQVMQKRNMMLALEKENVMTIAAALRSIPKKKVERRDPNADLFG